VTGERMNNLPQILICDDSAAVHESISAYLTAENMEYDSAYDGEEALKKASSGRYDLIILDVMLPKILGTDVCREIRKKSDVPILMLSARSEEVDRVLGLEIGADDYVTKPFSPSELMARVDAVYRRVAMTNDTPIHGNDENIVVSGDFILNLRNRTLSKNGKMIELTQVEFQIIEYFFNNPGAAISRTAILRKVWGDEYIGEEKIVDVNIRRLRMKVENEPSNPEHLITIWGIGYKWIS